MSTLYHSTLPRLANEHSCSRSTPTTALANFVISASAIIGQEPRLALATYRRVINCAWYTYVRTFTHAQLITRMYVARASLGSEVIILRYGRKVDSISSTLLNAESMARTRLSCNSIIKALESEQFGGFKNVVWRL